MAEVLLFHHAQGLTEGVIAFADELREAGHTVHTPDLFDGHTYGSIEEGMARVKSEGFDVIAERAVRLAEDLPAELVYAGMSLGVVPAQRLAQTRPGARGAVLLYSCLPAEYVGAWPDGLAAQVHGMDADPIFAEEGDLEAAEALAADHPEVAVFTYPGDQHYFADRSLPSYDEEATALLTERVVAFLAGR
ncbi:dienelactone hydrolase family protein [Euzebya sp.]|uniref:dienelactone hydrolase family protein n=1 Tax=Euzebya sp. TaxID=1971409 RepID=UPI003513408D